MFDMDYGKIPMFASSNILKCEDVLLVSSVLL